MNNEILEQIRKIRDKLKEKDPLAQRGIPETHVCVIHPRMLNYLHNIYENPRLDYPAHSLLNNIFWIERITGRQTYIRDTCPDDEIQYMSREDFEKLYG